MAAAPARALLYLAATQARNRWRWRLRRLREPRYLVGALGALAYVGWIAWAASERPDTVRPATLTLWALPLLVATHWLGRPSPLALAFAPAEVDLLFPAPLTRRALLHARLLGQQAATFAAILVWILLLDPARSLGTSLARGAGVWVMVTAVTLHRTGAALSRVEIDGAPRRMPLARALALAWLCALTVAMLIDWRALGALPDLARGPLSALADRFAQLTVAPRVAVALAPVRWIAAPVLATSPQASLAALPAALAVLLALYAWVVRDPRPFEEAAADATRRYADRIAAARRGAWRSATGRRRAPTTTRVPLPTRGPAALAFAWKTLVATGRQWALRDVLLAALAVAASAALVPALFPDPDLGAALRLPLVASFFTAAFLTLPSWFRQDLRAELGHLGFLKTAPVPLRDIVATQTAVAALVASTVLILLFGVPLALIAADDPLVGRLETVLLVVEALVVALPVVVLLNVTVHNAIAVVFPGWSRVGQAGVGGLQAMGQAYVSLAAVLAALGVLLALPVAAGAALLGLVPAPAGLALALPLGAAIAVGEWWLACTWLGRQLDRLEPDALPGAH